VLSSIRVHPCRWMVSSSLLFFSSFRRRGYTEFLVTQAERPVPSKTRLSFGYRTLPFFRYYTLSSVVLALLCRFIDRILSMFLLPLAVRVALTSYTFVS